MKVFKCFYVFFLVLFLSSCVTAKKTALFDRSPLKIEGVKVSAECFNPSSGEKVDISYELSRDARVTIKVYDPDWGMIAGIISNQTREKGLNYESWNGYDFEKKIVPDQAYFFTIEALDDAKNSAVYDPTVFSGGKEVDIVDVVYNRESGTISFDLPFSAWVLTRLGIKNGPLFKTLLDWEPRLQGENTVSWNGKDESGMLYLCDHPKFSMMVTTMSFPENSVIVKGNNVITYQAYKKQAGHSVAVKIKRPELLEKKNYKLSRHYPQPRCKDRAPEFSVDFENIKERTSEGIPVINEGVLLKVSLDEADKEFITGQRFEIVMYVDDLLYAEEEEGYSPFSWKWNMAGISEGEHLLTVNIVSLNDQVGTKSVKFFVKNTKK